MSLKEITTSILEDAEKKSAKIRDDGKSRADAIKRKYAVLVQEKQDSIHKQFEYRAKQKVEQARFRLQNQSSNAILNAKRKVIDEVYSDAAQELRKLSGESLATLFGSLISALPSVDGEICATANGRSDVEAAVKASGRMLTVSSETVEGNGGFIFRGNGVTIDNRFETLVVQARDDSEAEVAKIIFENA